MLQTINWKRADKEPPVGDECDNEILVSVARPEYKEIRPHTTTCYYSPDKGFWKDGYRYPPNAINFWAKMPDPHHDK